MDHVFPLLNLGYTMYLLEYNCSSLVNFVNIGYDKDIDPPVIFVQTSSQSSAATLTIQKYVTHRKFKIVYNII